VFSDSLPLRYDRWFKFEAVFWCSQEKLSSKVRCSQLMRQISQSILIESVTRFTFDPGWATQLTRIALLAHPAQPMTAAARVFPRDQAETACHLLPAGKALYRLLPCCAPFSRALVVRSQSDDSSERNRNSRWLPSIRAGPKGLSSRRLVHERPFVCGKQIRDGILPSQLSFDSAPSELAHSFSLVWII